MHNNSNEQNGAAVADLDLDSLGAEMAAEDLGGEATTPEQDKTRPANRWMARFTRVAFQTANDDRTFKANNGDRSKRLATFVLTDADAFFGINGNIYARLQSGSKTPTVEASFVGNRGTQAVVALDEASKVELSAMRAFIAQEYVKYRAAAPTTIRVTKIAVDLPDAGDLFRDE